MNQHTIKIGNAPRGSRNGVAAPLEPPVPVLSVDMNSMTFNVVWTGAPVASWHAFRCIHPSSNFEDAAQTSPQGLPVNYWAWVNNTDVDWELYVAGYDAQGNMTTPHSNTLTGHSPRWADQ